MDVIPKHMIVTESDSRPSVYAMGLRIIKLLSVASSSQAPAPSKVVNKLRPRVLLEPMFHGFKHTVGLISSVNISWRRSKEQTGQEIRTSEIARACRFQAKRLASKTRRVCFGKMKET